MKGRGSPFHEDSPAHSLFFRIGCDMAAVIEIPSALQKYVNNQKTVNVPEGTLNAAFKNLIGEFGELEQHLYDERGQIRSFVNIYVNDEDIRYAKNLDTEIKSGDIIQIVPSIAGGA